jgi:ribosomal 50S subunit-recycling heat shock protein
VKSFHRRTARAAPVPAAKAVAPVDRAGRVRADALLVERGIAPSRAAAQRLIAAGCVLADGRPVHKPSLELPAGCTVLLQDR